jgi:hypothetical protein
MERERKLEYRNIRISIWRKELMNQRNLLVIDLVVQCFRCETEDQGSHSFSEIELQYLLGF